MHTEKQRIFNEYAKECSKNLNDFRDLILNNVVNGNVDYIINHIYNVCDLVQQEQQNRIAERACIEPKGMMTRVDKASILNPNNIIS